MIEPLSQKERNELLKLVSDEQKEFLLNQLKRSRETIFGNFMLSEKVHAIQSADEIELLDDEQDVVDWMIVEYVDHGLGNRHGKCACGRSLRYEFTVQHTKTKKTIIYGKDHLAEFLNLNVRDIDGVIYELNTIDFELDELLIKIKEADYGYELLNGLSQYPKDIQNHVEHHIPLLNRQMKRLFKMIEEIKIVEQLEAYKKANTQIMKRFEKEKKVKQSREQEIMEIVHARLPTNASLGEIAFRFVQNGLSSATEISHHIRNHFHVEKRMSTGVMERPYIYIDVVSSLMEYVKQDYLLFDEESSGLEDCLFFINPHAQLENCTEIQETLF
ncbi:hypothetical protein SAMN05880501_11887 [Ureibacillus xyleni]|uniref:Uncharacterized protein n=1 Tax=Ureibacillus xyleni TaxID=614648 RepID=A0A285TRQ1_9BACL|nr:hypothetical protein [Ureibacillus xyleni]SOC25382.1 hypothetical protein SAMN05880501_11887 [Ureibacillus xyleni]